MSTGYQKRTRSEHVASVKLPPGSMGRIWGAARRTDVWLRLVACALAAGFLWTVSGGWSPPFPYRQGDAPMRPLVARVSFETKDEQATQDARERARASIECIYRHDPQLLVKLRQALRDRVFQLLAADPKDPTIVELWKEFWPDETTRPESSTWLDELSAGAEIMTAASAGVPLQKPVSGNVPPSVIRQAELGLFRQELEEDTDLAQFDRAVARALAPFEKTGLLESLQHALSEGSQTDIRVYTPDSSEAPQPVHVADVRIAQAAVRLRENLQAEMPSRRVSEHVFAWLRPKLPTTLQFDQTRTREAQSAAENEVPDVLLIREAGKALLAPAGTALNVEDLELLRKEHEAWVQQMPTIRVIYFTLAKFGMYVALYALCGIFLFLRHRKLIQDLGHLARMLALVCLAGGLGWFAAPSRAELVPLVLFAMTAAIVYDQEVALLVSASVALLVALSCGQRLMDLVVLLASVSAAVLFLRHIRNRTKIIYVGLCAAVVTVLTSMGVGTLVGHLPDGVLLRFATWNAGCVAAAGLVMAGLLPFVERLFGVQTELSLLELGDVAHPLLQELVRRAPGTYNHSINVASMAEAAAESIGANGLLVRVGAYFHDIGKIMNPEYFVENQLQNENRHESLMPAMSTLVIIAHVKDGADLARQHNLAQPMIDFIQQHHGTTLVEYFYRRASEQQLKADPQSGTPDEGNYRYPGPKPQTREAAVLMLADAVESASRTLVDPAPSRIEALVEDIAMNRLLDGQFDECGLTLRELRQVQDSLIKSLTAVYHGRIKYPTQRSA